MNFRFIQTPIPEVPVRKRRSKSITIDQTHDGIRVVKHIDNPVLIRAVILFIIVGMLALYAVTAHFPDYPDVSNAVLAMIPGTLIAVVVLIVLLMNSEQLEMSMSSVKISRGQFYRKEFSLGNVRDFRAVHNSISPQQNGWVFVFSTEEGDFSVCRNIDADSMEQIKTLVQKYFPSVVQPLPVSHVGMEQKGKRRIRSRSVNLGTQYWMPQSNSSTIYAVAATLLFLFMLYGVVSTKSDSPSWERMWGLVEEVAVYLVKATAVLAPFVLSALKSRYIEINSSSFTMGERPFGSRNEYPFTDIGDIRPSDWSLTSQYLPQCAVEVVIRGVTMRLFDGLSRQEAVALSDELRSAIGLRRGYGKLGSG